MKQLRYGILSTASIIPRFINAVRESGTGVISALASRDLLKAEETASSLNIPNAYGSYEELIAADDLDIIYVAMVNSQHYKYALMALESGKHVLCEKPITLEPDEAKDLFAAARRNRRFLMEGQKTVFLPVIQELKNIIQSGRLGAVTMIDCSSSYDIDGYTWYYNRDLGGGILYGNALYSIHMSAYLLGSPIEAFTGLHTASHTDIENQFATVMRHRNGTILVNKSSVSVETRNTAYLYGEKGHIEIPNYWKARSAQLHYKTGEIEHLNYPCEHEMIYEARHIYDCIQKGLCESPILTEEATVSGIAIIHELSKQWQSE